MVPWSHLALCGRENSSHMSPRYRAHSVITPAGRAQGRRALG